MFDRGWCLGDTLLDGASIAQLERRRLHFDDQHHLRPESRGYLRRYLTEQHLLMIQQMSFNRLRPWSKKDILRLNGRHPDLLPQRI